MCACGGGCRLCRPAVIKAPTPKREWSPGDVAVNEKFGHRGIFVANCTRHDEASSPSHWHNESGLYDEPSDNRRPLVVIDPEDRGQVERLGRAYVETWLGPREEASVETIDQMQAALRSLVTPPKPDEPQGLGAVVVADNEVEYVHLGSGLWTYGTTDGPAQGFAYDQISAVRILCEGVQP